MVTRFILMVSEYQHTISPSKLYIAYLPPPPSISTTVKSGVDAIEEETAPYLKFYLVFSHVPQKFMIYHISQSYTHILLYFVFFWDSVIKYAFMHL